MNDLTKGPWYVRYCDDERHMCMTVVSTKDYGDTNHTQYAGERDTVAIVYHQGEPLVMGRFDSDTDVDDRESVAALIAAAPLLRDTLKWLIDAVEKRYELGRLSLVLSDASYALWLAGEKQ
jgi:hypothetical protein